MAWSKVAGYLRAIEQEMDLAAEVARPRPLASVFIGGGTPSLLPPSDLARLMSALRDRFGLEPGAEVTMEANPENVTPATLDAWLAAGVTRLSLGMQSADEAALQVLQRVHTPGAAVAAGTVAAITTIAAFLATRALFDAWYRAVYLAARGTFSIVSAEWVTGNPVNSIVQARHGGAIRVVLQLDAAILDAPLESAPTDTAAVVTSTMDATDDEAPETIEASA